MQGGSEVMGGAGRGHRRSCGRGEHRTLFTQVIATLSLLTMNSLSDCPTDHGDRWESGTLYTLLCELLSCRHWGVIKALVSTSRKVLVPIVVTDHQLRALKQYQFIILQLWRSEVRCWSTGLKSRCHRDAGDSRGRIVALPSPASREILL